MGEKLGQVLKDIHIPDDVLAQLEKSLLHDQGRAESHAKAESEKLNKRLAQIRHRLEQAYIDKLDGKITEDFWESKSTEWNREQESILTALQTLDPKRAMATMDAVRTLELANKACFLYFRQPPAEKAKLLRMVLSNCKIDALSVYPVYKKPFGVIFKRVQSKEWLPGLDSNYWLTHLNKRANRSQTLFVAQGDHGVNARGAPRRNVASQQCNGS